MPPSIELFVRVAGGPPELIGLVHSVPPEGARVTFRDVPYIARRIVWVIGGGRTRMQATIELEVAVL
jgi:hypothetical protein